MRLVLLLPLLAGCFLPMATGAPENARTVGQGNFGASFVAEVPTLNLTAEEDDLAGSEVDNVAIAPAGALAVGVQYGVTETIDLEVRLDGALYYFIAPMPLGGSLGARVNLIDGPDVQLAIAARAGFLGFSSTDDDEGGDPDRASATYATATATLQLGAGFARPAITLSATPARVSVDLGSDPQKDYRALATTSTVALHLGRGPLTFAPFLAVTYFASPSVESQGFVTGGFAVYLGHGAYEAGPNLPAPRPYPSAGY